MYMKQKVIILTLVASSLLPEATYADSRAARQTGRNMPSVKLEAALIEGDSIEDSIDGEAEYFSRNASKGEIEGFKAEFEIPFPNSLLKTKADASNAEIELTLARKGEAYAKCFLDPDTDDEQDDDNQRSFRGSSSDDKDDDDDSSDASDQEEMEFKLDLSKKIRRNRVRVEERIGVCDLNLKQASIQSGLPKVDRGDSIAITLIKDGKSVVLLDGKFRRKR
jgi:hypothetical protein